MGAVSIMLFFEEIIKNSVKYENQYTICGVVLDSPFTNSKKLVI